MFDDAKVGIGYANCGHSLQKIFKSFSYSNTIHRGDGSSSSFGRKITKEVCQL